MRQLTALAIAFTTLGVVGRADALPAFARQTGMACTACHVSWPRLTDVGELFRDRGYRTGAVDNDTSGHPATYFPISFRAFVGYQYTSTTHQATDTGDTTVNTGGFVHPAADLYFSAALSRHLSVYVDIAGFSNDGTASVESTWVRINDIGTHWLNLKVGRLELDLPFSMHRAYTIFAPFQVYSYHPTGSSNGFTLNDNPYGVEIMGHEDGPGLRYSVAVTSSGDITSAWALNAPTLYAHVTYTRLFRSRVLPRVRVGAMSDVGWWPTAFKTLTPSGGMPQPVPGTGHEHKVHSRVGGDVQIIVGELARPITVTAVWMYGQEESGLVAGGTQDARFHGGFVQADYTPILPLTFGVRYDGVYNLQQADPTQPSSSNQMDGFTGFVRYAGWLSTWGSVIWHTELSTVQTQNAAAVPTNPVRNTFVFTGFDFLL